MASLILVHSLETVAPEQADQNTRLLQVNARVRTRDLRCRCQVHDHWATRTLPCQVKERLEQDLHNGFAQLPAFMLTLWVRATASTSVNTAAMATVMHWMIGFDPTLSACALTVLSVVAVANAWTWIGFTCYTLLEKSLGTSIPAVVQGVLSLSYLFIHPDRTPVWLTWTFVVSPIRWGIQVCPCWAPGWHMRPKPLSP